MSRHRYEFLLSALPGLDNLGNTPPMSKCDLLERIADAQGPVKTVEVLFLADDLMQREALLAGEITIEQADLAILSPTSEGDDSDLPPYLTPEGGSRSDNARLVVDDLWQRYFHHAWDVAQSTGSSFLRNWIGYEVGLRNAIVTARSQSLDLDPTTYLVTPELADSNLEVASLLSTWATATDPLAAQEVLDKARWTWLEENGGWYSFEAQEIESYAAKLMLLHRWRRIRAENTVEAT